MRFKLFLAAICLLPALSSKAETAASATTITTPVLPWPQLKSFYYDYKARKAFKR